MGRFPFPNFLNFFNISVDTNTANKPSPVGATSIKLKEESRDSEIPPTQEDA